MSHLIQYYWAQPFRLTSSIQIRVTVSAANYTATLAAGWYRHYLAPTTGGGATQDDPKEFGLAVAQAFEAAVAEWTIRMRTDGKWEITNGAGAWAVNWTVLDANGALVRNLLGYTANLSAAEDAYSAATYLPTHTLAAFSVPSDTGWQGELSDAASSTVATGQVIERSSGHVIRERELDIYLHPYTQADVSGDLSALPCTPVEGDRGRWKQPSATMTTGFVQPWSVSDTLFTCGGYELGMAPGNFQAHVAGSTLLYDAVYLDPACRRAAMTALISRSWNSTRQLKGLRFSYFGQETRA